jgi:hypothetical protein
MIFAYLINIYIYITSWFEKKQYDNSMEMMRMNSNNDDDNYLLYEETSNLIEKDNYYIPSLKEYKENKRFNKIQRSVSEPDYKYRYNCSNCKLYIHNQIFMYEDNSYCSEKCRQVKMNKKRFASSSF